MKYKDLEQLAIEGKLILEEREMGERTRFVWKNDKWNPIKYMKRCWLARTEGMEGFWKITKEDYKKLTKLYGSK